MATVTSKDGTQIAYEEAGQGKPVILVDGAFCFRQFGGMPAINALLSPHFRVFMYDRRGRGESGDTQPYAVEREIEDIASLLELTGGSAYVYGTSSGAILAMHAASKLPGLTKLAMYEPPLNDDPNARPATLEYASRLNALLAQGDRGGAAEWFMTYVGTPAEAIAGMRHAPVWGVFEAVAPTLAYDAAVLGDASIPKAVASSIKVPTLVMNGSTIPFMHATAQTLAEVIPNAQHRVFEGQGHDISAEAIVPALIEFFNS